MLGSELGAACSLAGVSTSVVGTAVVGTAGAGAAGAGAGAVAVAGAARMSSLAFGVGGLGLSAVVFLAYACYSLNS